MTCKNGTIYWNYPTGTIDLHFKDDRAFTACFRDELGVAVLELSDITTGAPKVFPSLFHGDDPDKDYCVTSVNNNLIIKMHAPFHAYVAAFSYQLRF
ncbi:hypothetical protein KP79_PYT17054 [Mizuhopecten yessoensis]|uniref:Uncharacterized protein n=1 Tax=Mizuhopecten yessoensis TaxID=6573 RepID=A0A210R2E1_MIZYE|nr:hypothetical protein KP79_PYT17054 [Mizuhopecten yessoensis]